MLKAMANGDQSELVRVMKNTLNVLRAVDTLTALRIPIHASMLTVLTDSSKHEKDVEIDWLMAISRSLYVSCQTHVL